MENDNEQIKIKQMFIISFTLGTILLLSNLAAFIFNVEINTVSIVGSYLLMAILFLNRIIFLRKYKMKEQ